jgi:hypothetical protein
MSYFQIVTVSQMKILRDLQYLQPENIKFLVCTKINYTEKLIIHDIK